MLRLRWHYFGDIASVLYASPTTFESNECGSGRVADYRAAASTSMARRPPPGDGDPPLVHYVRRAVQEAEGRGERKGGYEWRGGPLGLDVRVRKFPEAVETRRGPVRLAGDEFVIGPTRLVLPWPFAPDVDLDPGPVQDLQPDDYDKERDVLGARLLAAGDALVGTDGAAPHLRPSDLRAELIEVARKMGGGANFDLPDNVDVRAVGEPTNRSGVLFEGRAITLLLGTGAAAGPKGPGPEYDKWPCGAFRSGG